MQQVWAWDLFGRVSSGGGAAGGPYMTCVQEWDHRLETLPLSLELTPLSSYCVWSGEVGPWHLQKVFPLVCPGL